MKEKIILINLKKSVKIEQILQKQRRVKILNKIKEKLKFKLFKN